MIEEDCPLPEVQDECGIIKELKCLFGYHDWKFLFEFQYMDFPVMIRYYKRTVCGEHHEDFRGELLCPECNESVVLK